MRYVLACLLCLVSFCCCEAADYSVDAFTKGTTAYAGWGAPSTPYRIHLVRYTNNVTMPFIVVSTVTPASGSGNAAFTNVAPGGPYSVMMEFSPRVFRASSDQFDIK